MIGSNAFFLTYPLTRNITKESFKCPGQYRDGQVCPPELHQRIHRSFSYAVTLSTESKELSVSWRWYPSHLVSVGIVGLHAAEDRLVLTEASTDIDPALVSHHGTPEPVITDWIRRRREGDVLLDCGDRLLSN